MAEADAKQMANSARMYWAAEGYTSGGTVREVDYATQTGGAHPLFEGIKIVDCDTHFTEPADLFTSRAPAKYRDKVPFMRRDADNVDRWYIGERNCGTVGGSVIRKDYNKILGRLAFPTMEEAHASSYSVKPRLRMMDDMGVHAQICFQNSGVTQPGSLMTLGDPELAITIVRIFNDACADYQQESGQRIFNMAHLPFWDKAAMEVEARRCIDLGIKGFVLPDKPEMFGVAGYLTDHWDAVLDICNDAGMPLNFHINVAVDPGTMIWEGFSFERRLSIHPIMHSLACAVTLGNWMLSGRLDRHPRLKIGLIEAGLGWVPFVLEMLTHQMDEMDTTKLLKKRPWEYFRDHFWTTFWFEKIGPQIQLDILGVDNVLFETDFPHPTSLYPDVQAHIVEAIGGHPYEVRKKVLQSNASRLYNLPF